MDELEQATNRALNLENEIESEQEEAAKIGAPVSSGEAVQVLEPSEAAGNMAETVLGIGFGVCKMLMDSRLEFGAEELASGRESLAPVIEKYNLAGGGDGRIPFWQEIGAGLYLGGLYKRIKRALTELKAKDKSEREAREQANNKANRQSYGDQRKHKPQEQSHSVPSKERIREEPNINPNF